jgi:hypothetical protein
MLRECARPCLIGLRSTLRSHILNTSWKVPLLVCGHCACLLSFHDWLLPKESSIERRGVLPLFRTKQAVKALESCECKGPLDQAACLFVASVVDSLRALK